MDSLLTVEEGINKGALRTENNAESRMATHIALAPLLCTIINIIPLVCCTPACCLRPAFAAGSNDRRDAAFDGTGCPGWACACVPNLRVDFGCMCCGLPGCVAGTLTAWPLGLGYFVDLFQHRVGNYVKRLVSRRKVSLIE